MPGKNYPPGKMKGRGMPKEMPPKGMTGIMKKMMRMMHRKV